jgi:hypothetical protein
VTPRAANYSSSQQIGRWHAGRIASVPAVTSLDRDWLDTWWAQWLACTPQRLRDGGVVVAEARDHVGVFHVRHGAPVVYGPAALLALAGVPTTATYGDATAALGALTDGLDDRASQVLGPASYGYLTSMAGCAVDDRVRLLGPRDDDLVAAFEHRVPVEEWGEAAVGGAETFGWVEAGEVRAAASLGDWRGVPSVGVVTDPAWRGRRHGWSVVAAAAAHALGGGADLVQYRARTANTASMALARALGVQSYATGGIVDVVT